MFEPHLSEEERPMRRIRWTAALAALVVAAGLLGARSASAQDYCSVGFQPDLFYNYYVGPVSCHGQTAVGAQLYVSPLPVPPLVGHTYITYQPLLPQEFLYQHKRCYVRSNGPYSAPTFTHISWH
jgi:hypothetical protein